jgi:hypothetical protein
MQLGARETGHSRPLCEQTDSTCCREPGREASRARARLLTGRCLVGPPRARAYIRRPKEASHLWPLGCLRTLPGWWRWDRADALLLPKICPEGSPPRQCRPRFRRSSGDFRVSGRGHHVESLPSTEVLRIAPTACSSQIIEVEGALGTGMGDTPAAWPPRSLRASSTEKGPVSWPFAKPSPGLEPGAASLPWRFRIATDVGRNRSCEAVSPAIAVIQALRLTCLRDP